MAIVGYKLIKTEDGSVVEQWGGIWGQCPGVPNPINLPNGDIVCAPELDTDYSGYQLVVWEMEQPNPTVSDVIAERSRRLALGFDYDFGNGNVQHVGTTDDDMKGWEEVTTWGNAQIALGNTTSTITILTDSGSAVVTAMQWMSVINAASAFRQPIWAASFALQAMNPIPMDYTDDKWW